MKDTSLVTQYVFYDQQIIIKRRTYSTYIQDGNIADTVLYILYCTTLYSKKGYCHTGTVVYKYCTLAENVYDKEASFVPVQ